MDPRLGIKGIFVSDEKFGPMLFSLLPYRAKAMVNYETKDSKFVKGYVKSLLPLNEEGYLYTIKLRKEELWKRKSGGYFLIKPIQVLRCKKIIKEQVLKLGWKIFEKS